MPKITRTMGQFHFEDLEPKRFEDLIRALANDFKDWQSIEATGRGGSDDGIDIRAYERVAKSAETESLDDDADGAPALHPMQGNMWVFQCKREKEIGPKRVSGILTEIDQDDPPYGYVLAAPANFSKTSYDTFRADLIKKGVMEFYVWGRAELEGMLLLPKNDRILFTFFGISLVSKRRSKSTEVRGKITNKNKLLGVLGAETGHWPVLLRDINDEHYPFDREYLDFEKHPRWKQYEARRLHPHGLVVRQRHWYAWMDVGKEEFDFTELVSLIPPHMSGDDSDDWQERQKQRDIRDAVEDFWDHLPNRNRVEYARHALVKFEDMLVIDDKGIGPNKCPHIFVDFSGKGPFTGFSEFLEVRRGYGDPERVMLDGFKRVKMFPETFASPTIGTIHAEGAVQLDADTHRLLVNGNEGIREYCVTDSKLSFLKPRDIFVLKGGRDNALKYFLVTHTYTTTVGAYCGDRDQEFYKAQLEGKLGKELTGADILNVVEFKQTYDRLIERLKGGN